MAKFHVNPVTGNVGACSADKGDCPFGGPQDHYASAAEGRAAFEAGKNPFPAQGPLKKLTFNGRDWKNVTLEGARYSTNEEIAILSYIDEGYGNEPLTTITVNLDELGQTPRPGAFFVKNWGENSGIAEGLENAGVMKPTGRRISVNDWNSEAVEMELTPKYSYLAADANWGKFTDESKALEK